jgi:hypothetical protein
MSKTKRRWLLGCGIGCAALALVIAGLIAGSFFFFRDALRDFEQADRTMETVAERFGPVSDFRPDFDGVIRPERIEAFLTARDAVAGTRQEMDRSLNVLSAKRADGATEGGDSRLPKLPAGVIGKTRAGLWLLHQLADFLRQRNDALLESEIGLGEYYYIYTLAYYGWLEKSPADGPSFKLVGERGYVLESVENLPEAAVRSYRVDLTSKSLNRLLLPVLENQLSDLKSVEGGSELQAWRQMLEAEIQKLEANPNRIPWENGLPGVIVASLEPFRDRLESSYSVMCNALEIGVARRDLGDGASSGGTSGSTSFAAVGDF